MDRYILFFDIDGTILDTMNKQTEPSKYFKQAISQLQTNGHLCFIASGRPYIQLNESIKELGFDGYVLCNGGVVIRGEDVLISHFFPTDEAKEIQRYFEEKNAPYTVISIKDSYVPKRFKSAYSFLEEFGVPVGPFTDDFDIDELDVVKFETASVTEEVANYIRGLKEKGYEVDEYTDANIFEFGMPYVTKGKSILDLLELLNIPVENSVN